MRGDSINQLVNRQLVLFLSVGVRLKAWRRHLWLSALIALGTPAVWAAVATTAQPKMLDMADMAERTRACAACHGEQGRAGPDGYYPRLAGKPAGYLYNQLLNFKQGRRHYGLMTRLVDPLTPEYMWDMAQYFASLSLPYPPPSAKQPVLSAAQIARGKQLALEGDRSLSLPACNTCHGERLTGMLPATPGLLGLPRDYINAQLGAWRSAQRRAHAPDCMAQIAQRLSPDDLHAVASWLGMQALPANTHPVSAMTPQTRRSLAQDMHCGSAPLPTP